MMNSMIGRKFALWLSLAFGVLALTAPASSTAAGEEPCNGSVELCGRSLDQVVLPGTHNSMSNEEYGWALPNQHYSIPTQLDMGIRAFLVDTHYGKPNGSGKITNVGEAEGHATDATIYFCHEYCTLGSTELVPELAKVAAFLSSHPREVLVFVNESYVDPTDFAKAVTESGLIDYVYTGSTDTYPTLGQMIAQNQRVLMLSESGTGSVSWYHAAYQGAMQETPYDFRVSEAGDPLTTRQGMDLLTGASTLDSTCRPNRGGTSGNLFLMNHWVNGYLDNSNPTVPDPAVAQVLNQREVLVNRARACETRRGKLPNIVAVDDFGDGDLLGAVRELNGLTRPLLSLRRPARRAVRAGRKATYKLTVRNLGDDDAPSVKVCVAVPKRLAVKPKCRSLSLNMGESRTVKFSVRTRRKGRGAGKVTFKVSGWGDTVATSAGLKVKPLKKRNPA